jgi:peptidoglycan LD-endopeptidase LytH
MFQRGFCPSLLHHTPISDHPTKGMKHLIAIFVLVIVTGIVLDQLPERQADQFAMPWRLLRLQMQEPDTELLMPVQNASVLRIANTWQAPRPGGREHHGQDIFARRGTPVVSATDGIVIRVGTNTLGGNTVSIVGAGGRMYYYAHLDSYAEGLAAGNQVRAGDRIGHVGNTGNARGTPPHLHFGVYSAAGALNPLPLLVDASAFRAVTRREAT